MTITILDNDAPGNAGRGANEFIESIAMQTDGKAFIGGNASAINGEQRTGTTLMRLNTNGLRDATFTAAVVDNVISKLAIDPSGKVLGAGYFSTASGQPRGRIARWLTNGTLDTTFAVTNGANVGVSELVALPDGKVLIGGDFTTFDGVPRGHVARLNANGTLDRTFDPGASIDTAWLFALNAQTNGQVLIGGSFSRVQGQYRQMLARLDSNGALDPTFNPGQIGPESTVNFINTLPDGNLLIGGWFLKYNGVPRNRIARLMPDGVLDTTFVPNWDAATSTTWNVALQSDGKIIVVGWQTSASGLQPNYIARLQTNGQPDLSFQIGPGANAAVNAVGILPDDRVLIGGQFTVLNGFNRYRLAFLNADGSLPDDPVSWLQWPSASGGNDHWYALTSRPNDWPNTEAEAMANGGHLASVSSAEEQSFLETTFLKGLNRIRPFWIGLNDVATEGNFVWSSGEPLNFSKWYAGEPSHSSVGEDFIAFNWFYSYWLGDQVEPAFGRWVDVTQAGTIGGNPYQVVVSNPIGSVSSYLVTLDVLLPPVLTRQPSDAAVPLGASVTFCVEATGTSPFQFQWRKNGVNLAAATDSCYTIPKAQIADGGAYSAIVSSQAGSVLSGSARLTITQLPNGPPAEDDFTTRRELAGLNGVVSVNNVGATKQPGEPNHAGKPGGSSVWYTWQAPNQGIATLRTSGSAFDTLLAVYTGATVSNLVTTASDEDRGGYLASEVSFNAQAGAFYQIAVDGYAGGQGDFILSWALEVTLNELPLITTQPQSQTVPRGAGALLSVQATGPGLQYQWIFNGSILPDATSSSLVLTNVQPRDVGTYTVRITNPQGRMIESLPAVLEIGLLPAVQSQDKLEDLFLNTRVLNPNGLVRASANAAGGISVRAGAIGSHTLTNSSSTNSGRVEVNTLCGLIGGERRWFDLRVEDPGILTIDTEGSEIDTLLGTFTFGSTGLTPVACDDDGAPDGRRSRVRFAAVPGRDYLVGIDGKGGRTGVIQLNWSLGVPLTARRQGHTLLLSWPASFAVFGLQEASGLPPAASPLAWSVVSQPAPTVVSGTNTISLPLFGTAKFYRLWQP